MTANWLYPLSSTADRWFENSLGDSTDDTSYESFKVMFGWRETDDVWSIATNFRRVNEGDRVWCYYGWADDNIGVVALAEIDEVLHDERASTHELRLRWDKPRTKALIKNPVPALEVRRYIKRPRRSVWSLDKYPKLVETLLHHAGITAGRKRRTK